MACDDGNDPTESFGTMMRILSSEPPPILSLTSTTDVQLTEQTSKPFYAKAQQKFVVSDAA